MKAKMITYKGKTQSARRWAEETGLSAALILDRLQKKWTVEEALTYPKKQRREMKYEYQGGLYTATELARMHGGVCPSTMRQRLYDGMSVEEAMQKPNARPARKTRITEEKQKQIFCKPVKKRDYTQCKTCQYRTKDLLCGYREVTGHCRLLISEASPNCTVYVKGKSLVQAAVMRKLQRGMVI